MRFLLLTPGTGHFFCGSCLRDHTLRRALTALGHEVSIAPLYLPHVLEDEERAIQEQQVHMGGINMYLQHKSRIGRRLPGFVQRMLDRPGLLRWASKRGGMTEAPDLGALTLSMLRGEDGKQRQEVAKLVQWVQAQPKPDVILLSNVMLIGVVRSLRAQLSGCRIAVTLQGEQPFLDALEEPYRSRAWSELRVRARDVDMFFPVSETYGGLMRDRLELDASRCKTLHNGIDLAGFEAPTALGDRAPRTIGYLARMCKDKGLHTLIDAFVDLAGGDGREDFTDVRLHVVGVKLREDEAYVRGLEERLTAAGLRERVTFTPNATRAQKLEALSSWSLFSVPATYGESFGLYLLEAWASALPVVQPRHGAFEEVLSATGGGLLCEADDSGDLSQKLQRLLRDPEEAAAIGQAGLNAVRDRFHAEGMAERFAAACAALL